MTIPAAWWAGLSPIVARLADEWSLALGERFPTGGTAWVAPARGPDGADLVLKVVWPHPEAVAEAAGLRCWDGDGAVRLVAATRVEGNDALLLERCRPGTPLAAMPEPDQDVTIAGLLRRLWRAPPPGATFPTLAAMCDLWAGEFEAKVAAGAVALDPGLAREGAARWRALPREDSERVLLATDLHAGNVLAAEREPWLVIDPKPHVGDPAYDPLQHLLNCPARLHADPLALTRRVAGLCGVDADRLAAWLFARSVIETPSWPELAGLARRLAPG
ncbi:MAG TPA: aminoglycoside phosphotransferase family protein [Acidimicrobiales bacterium]|nr:aminoglycoside phosphotransferase family protein [Acidimicrobiales bacterium]